MAVLTTLKELFPNTNIHGCWFHLNQNIFRKAQEIGLQPQYQSDTEFARQIKLFSCLAFVPPKQNCQAKRPPWGSSCYLLNKFRTSLRSQWLSLACLECCPDFREKSIDDLTINCLKCMLPTNLTSTSEVSKNEFQVRLWAFQISRKGKWMLICNFAFSPLCLK